MKRCIRVINSFCIKGLMRQSSLNMNYDKGGQYYQGRDKSGKGRGMEGRAGVRKGGEGHCLLIFKMFNTSSVLKFTSPVFSARKF